MTGRVLVTALAVVAVIVDRADTGQPGLGLQLMKLASQMPAQTCPPAETVTRLVLLLEEADIGNYRASGRILRGRRDRGHLAGIQREAKSGSESS